VKEWFMEWFMELDFLQMDGERDGGCDDDG